MKKTIVSAVALGAALVAGENAPTGPCVVPGVCTPPNAKYHKVIRGPSPGQQWNINGGFCGSFSTQQAGLAKGAYVSQDLVRKSNRGQVGPYTMHGNATLGYEVMPSNVEYTVRQLRFKYDFFDYTSPQPQAKEYMHFLKKHLTQGNPVIWFPLCKGDTHICYTGTCPNGGHIDHVESMYGFFSNHSLDDYEVYDDDVILHTSDQDFRPYYRVLSKLGDDTKMEGNCASAVPGFRHNEMYPCFYNQVSYGVAITDLDVAKGGRKPVSITLDSNAEPNVRIGQKPSIMRVYIEVTELTAGQSYTLYRYNDRASMPTHAPWATNANAKVNFVAQGPIWTKGDLIISDQEAYFICA